MPLRECNTLLGPVAWPAPVNRRFSLSAQQPMRKNELICRVNSLITHRNAADNARQRPGTFYHPRRLVFENNDDFLDPAAAHVPARGEFSVFFHVVIALLPDFYELCRLTHQKWSSFRYEILPCAEGPAAMNPPRRTRTGHESVQSRETAQTPCRLHTPMLAMYLGDVLPLIRNDLATRRVRILRQSAACCCRCLAPAVHLTIAIRNPS